MSFWLQSDQSWHLQIKWLACQNWLCTRFEIVYFQEFQCQSLKNANGLLGVLLSNAKFVYVIIILIRRRVRTSCHSRHPSYGVTARSFEVLLFEECKSHGVRASGCLLHCICAGVFVPQTFTAKASEVPPIALVSLCDPPPQDMRRNHRKHKQSIRVILSIETIPRWNQIADYLASATKPRRAVVLRHAVKSLGGCNLVRWAEMFPIHHKTIQLDCLSVHIHL